MKDKPKILIVDDDLLILKIIENMINQLGYTPITANNGQEALNLAENEVFDLIISDLHMPLIGGNRFVKEIRAKHEYKFTPFIFISSESNKETWIKNLNDGADDFVLKPFDKDVFKSKINAHLKKSLIKKEQFKQDRQQNLSHKLGKIILCSHQGSNTPKLLNTNTEITIVNSEKELYNSINSDIWLILIEEKSAWITSKIDKLNTFSRKNNFQISVIVPTSISNNNVLEFQKQELGIIFCNDNSQVLNNQINTLIKREQNIRDKYLSSISEASNNSVVRFDKQITQEFSFVDLQIKHEPFKGIPGGDFYETFNLSSNKKLIVIGDVMGKKWDAWFFVSAYIAYIRSIIKFHINNNTQENLSPSSFLELLNNSLYKDAQLSEVFTTLSVILVDKEDKKIDISSAGALRPLLYNAEENLLKTLNLAGTLLGLIQDIEYHNFTIRPKKDDLLIIFTDGYSEATNSKTGEMINDNTIISSLENNLENNNLTTNKFEDIICSDNNINSFNDDRTLLIISCR